MHTTEWMPGTRPGLTIGSRYRVRRLPLDPGPIPAPTGSWHSEVTVVSGQTVAYHLFGDLARQTAGKTAARLPHKSH